MDEKPKLRYNGRLGYVALSIATSVTLFGFLLIFSSWWWAYLLVCVTTWGVTIVAWKYEKLSAKK